MTVGGRVAALHRYQRRRIMIRFRWNARSLPSGL